MQRVARLRQRHLILVIGLLTLRYLGLGLGCNVSPLRVEKPQNRPLSKLNTDRFALRAMLPVITNRKSHMRFRLLAKSVIFNDFERRNGPYFALFHRIRLRCRRKTITSVSKSTFDSL